MSAKLPNGDAAQLVCNHTVSLNVELQIRHGTSLILRRGNWLVTDQEVGEPLKGRPLLRALGLDTQNILEPAISRQ